MFKNWGNFTLHSDPKHPYSHCVLVNAFFSKSFFYYYLNFSLLSFQLGNIHLPWDLIINRNRLDGLIYNLESFLQLNMCQELQIFAFVYMYLDAS
jgi:hypothetical protein